MPTAVAQVKDASSELLEFSVSAARLEGCSSVLSHSSPSLKTRFYYFLNLSVFIFASEDKI